MLDAGLHLRPLRHVLVLLVEVLVMRSNMKCPVDWGKVTLRWKQSGSTKRDFYNDVFVPECKQQGFIPVVYGTFCLYTKKVEDKLADQELSQKESSTCSTSNAAVAEATPNSDHVQGEDSLVKGGVSRQGRCQKSVKASSLAPSEDPVIHIIGSANSDCDIVPARRPNKPKSSQRGVTWAEAQGAMVGLLRFAALGVSKGTGLVSDFFGNLAKA